MQTLNFDAVIDERRILSLVLPDSIRPGRAKVTVMLETERPLDKTDSVKSAAKAAYDELLRFGDGRRLGGLSIKELVAEGRR